MNGEKSDSCITQEVIVKVNKTKIRLKMVPVDYRPPNCKEL